MTAATRTKPKAIAKYESMAKKSLASFLRSWLEEKDLTMSDLAEEIGTSLPTVSNWVHGTGLPSVPYLMRIAEVTGRDPATMLQATADKKATKRKATKKKKKVAKK